MHRPLAACAAILSLAACSQPAETPKASAPATTPAASQPAPVTAPAGLYTLDPAHSAVTFEVSHIGMSSYTAGFDKIAGQLQFDPANPTAMSVNATADVASLDLPAPPAGFHQQMMSAAWFDAGRHPQITFRSTRVEPTGARTARVTGDLTLRGVTRPITLEATYNDGYPPNGMDPSGSRIGLSARGVLKRSEFGMSYGIPEPGSKMGVGDEVTFRIEAEFTKSSGAVSGDGAAARP
jgi:polyisoprenoid-binding protein YceI